MGGEAAAEPPAEVTRRLTSTELAVFGARQLFRDGAELRRVGSIDVEGHYGTESYQELGAKAHDADGVPLNPDTPDHTGQPKLQGVRQMGLRTWQGTYAGTTIPTFPDLPERTWPEPESVTYGPDSDEIPGLWLREQRPNRGRRILLAAVGSGALLLFAAGVTEYLSRR